MARKVGGSGGEGGVGEVGWEGQLMARGGIRNIIKWEQKGGGSGKNAAGSGGGSRGRHKWGRARVGLGAGV